jgi:hypothetical protein
LNLTLSLIVLLTIGLASTAVLRRNLSFGPSHTSTSNLTSAPEKALFENGPVRMIRFVLLRDGLYPNQMHVDQGTLNIALEDKTGGSEGLLIESAQGDSRTKTQIRRAETTSRGRMLIKLTPGRYVVSDASQPSHKAELIVNP